MGLFNTNKPTADTPTGLVTTSKSDSIAMIRINNAAHSNVFTRNMVDQLTTAFETISADDDTRCVVLAAEGVHFSAGPSLIELASFTVSDAQKYWRAGRRLTDAIWEARQPVICAIQGSCVSVGLAVALACDIRIAAGNARLSFPDVSHIQLVPGWGATQRLVHTIGTQDAKFMLITGAALNAEEAHEYRLVHGVVSIPELETEAREMAKRVAAAPLHVLERVKQAINGGVDVEHGTAMHIEEQAWLGSWDIPGRTDIINDATHRLNLK